ncbi:MAG: alpha/beta hydrolase [Candidatus Latescibacteria bacterium]|jgi:acetyl esterase/lipase|nr:alpha/beta hydrolase [Candidatus Latescibacterota bacterium]
MADTTGADEAKDPIVMELWPGEVPGDEGIEGEENVRIHDSRFPGIGKTRLITNVTRPSIKVCLPPRDANTGTAMVICPGGGYHDLFWDLEGEEVAAWLVAQGIAGVILKYRCPRRPGDAVGVPPPGPQLDAQRAISTVRSRAGEWGIDPGRIGIGGFSAGGHLALATAIGFPERKYDPIDEIDEASCRPDFAVPCYSGYLRRKEADAVSEGIRIPPDTPSVFLAHASDDSESEVAHSVIAYLALHRAGVPTELHVFATGEHDFGVRQNHGLPASWPHLMLRWLRSLGLLSNPGG